MGRTEPSVGRPPAAFRKDARAKKAKATINQLIPSLLTTHPRARSGIGMAELIVEPPPYPPKKPSQDSSPAGKDEAARPSETDVPNGPLISLRVADTLSAAHSLLASDTASDPDNRDLSNKIARVAILNMASPLSPGGGFLNGATSQEESLCMRTTLLPSLKDEYYRLPELGAIYTPDVLVFREVGADEVLSPRERWFVDCISAAMLRAPEIDLDEAGQGFYTQEKDRELALGKMRMVMRICRAKGIKKMVLGAWGCGAHGNPVGEVARAWRKVLIPTKRGSRNHNKKSKKSEETWEGLDEVVFAIKEPGLAEAFAVAFGEGIVRQDEYGEGSEDDGDGNTPEEDEEDTEMCDPALLAQILQLKSRIEATQSPQLKQQLSTVLAGLTKSLEGGSSS